MLVLLCLPSCLPGSDGICDASAQIVFVSVLSGSVVEMRFCADVVVVAVVVVVVIAVVTVIVVSVSSVVDATALVLLVLLSVEQTWSDDNR